jgi:RNA polymerase sigma factor (sigma-70 family)
MSTLTDLLQQWDRLEAREEVVPRVIEHVRNIVRDQRLRAGPHSVQTDVLADDALMRVFRRPDLVWDKSDQFFGYLAVVIRNLLRDHARRRQAAHAPLREEDAVGADTSAEVVIRDLLEQLDARHPPAGRVVVLHDLEKHSQEEIARLLTETTRQRYNIREVRALYRLGRAWLLHHLQDHCHAPDSPGSR